MRDSFEIIDGNNKIMFSAPHAVEQLREGKIKQAEPDTGIIARRLSEKGYPAIIKTFNDDDDANYDAVSSYKYQLRRYINENDIRYLFDLHELSPLRTMDVCIGTGKGRNILYKDELIYIAKHNFEKSGFSNITIDEPFAACGETTISACISRECHIPVVQIEMNSKYFCESERYIDYFTDMLDEIAREYIQL